MSLGPEALAFADNAKLMFEIAKRQAPLEELFEIYQRIMSGQRQPGDVVTLARRLIAVFGSDGASLLWQLGKPDEQSLMGLQLILQERKGHLADVSKRLNHHAKRLKRRRNEAEIFNAIQLLVDEGTRVDEAFALIAGHGVAVGKGTETLKKIWQAKNREIKAGAPRLRPAAGLHPWDAEVIAPGKPAKKTGRPKKR